MNNYVENGVWAHYNINSRR